MTQSNPLARLQLISYEGGTVMAPLGLIQFLFGEQNLKWLPQRSAADAVTGRRRRKYGSRQRQSARAGEAMTVVLTNGQQYTCRITGSHTDFIDNLLAKAGETKVSEVYSERGAKYGRQFAPPIG